MNILYYKGTLRGLLVGEGNSKRRGLGYSDFGVGWDIFLLFFDCRVLGRGEG